MGLFRDTHKGWVITFNRNRPVTGAWRAEKFGVGMCNNSRESLVKMIDVKEDEYLAAVYGFLPPEKRAAAYEADSYHAGEPNT